MFFKYGRLFSSCIVFFTFVNYAESVSYEIGGAEEYYCKYAGVCPNNATTVPQGGVRGQNCPKPKNGIQIGRSKYIFIDETLVKWELSRSFCQENKLQLASIRSLQEQAVIDKFISGNVNGKFPADATFWIGANDYNSEGSFHWANGEQIGFQKFWEHNPNNDKTHTQGRYGEHCVELMYFPDTTQSWWNDQICSQKKRFFCEFSESMNSGCFTAEPKKRPQMVQIGNTEFYSSGAWQMSWKDALDFCAAGGLSLLSIPDTATMKKISDALRNDPNPKTHYWTSGLFSPKCCDKGSFTWQTLRDASRTQSSHLSWWKNEPFDQGGIGGENCVEFLHLGGGQIDFSASHCSLPFQFICSKSTESSKKQTKTRPKIEPLIELRLG